MYRLSDKLLAMVVRAHAALRQGLGYEDALVGDREVDQPNQFASWLLFGQPLNEANKTGDLPDWAQHPSNKPVNISELSTDLVNFDPEDWSKFETVIRQVANAVRKDKADQITYMLSPGITGDGQELLTVRICSLLAPQRKATVRSLLPNLAASLETLLGDVRVSARLGISASLQSGVARPGTCASNSDASEFTQTIIVRGLAGSALVKADEDDRYVIVPGHGLYDTGRREFHNSVYQPPGEIDARSLVGRIPEPDVELHVRFDHRMSRLKNLDGAAVPLSTPSSPHSIIPSGLDAPIMATEPPSEDWMDQEVIVFTGKNGVRTARITAVRDEIQITDHSGAPHDYRDICVLQDTALGARNGRPPRLTRNGDSGSPVCIRRGTTLRLLGYVIGGSNRNGSEGRTAESYFLPAETLFEALGVEIAT